MPLLFHDQGNVESMTPSSEADPVVCKFIAYQPSAIKLLASTIPPLDPLHPTIGEALSARLAVYREQEHRLEILYPSCDWSIETRMTTGTNEADIVEAMCWTCNGRNEGFEKILWPTTLPPANKKNLIPYTQTDSPPQHRLFTAGPDGVVKEWDWRRGIIVRQTDTNPPIWSMCRSPDNRFLATGHEDGRIRIHKLVNAHEDGEEDCLELERMFEASAITSTESERIISMAWGGDRIATGYQLGLIKLWDARTGRSSGQLDLRVEGIKPFINCLHFQTEATLVSADSTGHLNFWDVVVRAAICTIKTHDADILCMTGQGDMVFASGVDHRTVKVALINSGEIEAWTVVSGRRQHTNDVRSMCLAHSFYMDSKQQLHCRPVLVSGGVDANLEMSDPLKTQQTNLEDRRFDDFPVFQRQVVKLRNGRLFALLNNRKSFEIWTLTGQRHAIINTGTVHDWEVDEEGTNVMVLTGDNRCKHFVINDADVSVNLVNMPPNCHLRNICYTQGHWFIRAIRDNENVFIKSGREIFAVPGEMLDRMMSLGPNLICLIDTDNRVHRWTKTACLDVLQLPSTPVAMHVTNENVLIVITADNRVWKMDEMVLSEIPSHTQEWSSLNNRFIGIVPEGTDALWISSIGTVQNVMSASASKEDEGMPRKRSKKEGNSKHHPLTSGPFDAHKPFLFFGIHEGKKVLVQRPWSNVIAALPAAFQRRKYGIS